MPSAISHATLGDKMQSVDAPKNLSAVARESDGFTIRDTRDVMSFLWRRWKIILAVTAVAALIGALYIARQTPLYTATVQLLIDPQKGKVTGEDLGSADDVLNAVALDSQMTIMKSSVLLRYVVEKQGLLNDPEFSSTPEGPATRSGGERRAPGPTSGRSSGKDQMTPAERENDERSNSLADFPPEVVATIDNLKRAIAVTRPPSQGMVINIDVSSVDPKKAARLAQAIADAYVLETQDARFDKARRATEWLRSRSDELRAELRRSEEAVNNFRKENNLVLTSAGQPLSLEQLDKLNGRLAALRADAAEKKVRLELLREAQERGGDISILPDGLVDSMSPTIGDLRRRLADVSRQLADLRARYRDTHPMVVNMRAQFADLQRGISVELRRLTQNIKKEFDAAVATQGAIEKSLRDISVESSVDDVKSVTLRELNRDVAVNKSLFEDFLSRSRTTEEESTFAAMDARVITPALEPTSPSSPRKLLIMLAALALGLTVGAGGAFLFESLDAGFTTPHQVESLLERPVLASISKIAEQDLLSEEGGLTIACLPIRKPLSRVSEAFRSLRTAINMASIDQPPGVVQITSTVAGEGKSTIALALAASAAQSGLKVMLVDCDLRRPGVTKYLKVDAHVGLVDVLTGEVELGKAVGYDEKHLFYFLSAGAKTQNPADLLASERFKVLVSFLREKFDLVICDTPPMGPVNDPLVAASVVDKIVYVVRWASTAREMVAQQISRISPQDKVAGVVLNYVDEAQAAKYGRYADSYYYYGRSYHDKYYQG